mmetsp:Transcript_83835/g.211423  ORF Transcript_83835/g.211423 Transcript_83835/m.211423 type:complete len:212 (-) Transcript_83835:117-752(-)
MPVRCTKNLKTCSLVHSLKSSSASPRLPLTSVILSPFLMTSIGFASFQEVAKPSSLTLVTSSTVPAVRIFIPRLAPPERSNSTLNSLEVGMLEDAGVLTSIDCHFPLACFALTGRDKGFFQPDALEGREPNVDWTRDDPALVGREVHWMALLRMFSPSAMSVSSSRLEAADAGLLRIISARWQSCCASMMSCCNSLFSPTSSSLSRCKAAR